MNLQGNVGQISTALMSKSLLGGLKEVSKASKNLGQQTLDAKANSSAAQRLALNTQKIDEYRSEVALMRLNRYVAAHAHFRERPNTVDLFGMRQRPVTGQIKVGGTTK